MYAWKHQHTSLSLCLLQNREESFIILSTYHLYGLTYDAPSSARLSTLEKKEMNEEVLIVDPETPITREEYEKEIEN